VNILLLGKGKTGSLVAEIALERGHKVRVAGREQNAEEQALVKDNLRDVDVVIDFTAPDAVVGNIEACARQGKSMVVGTTGWYGELPRLRRLVEDSGIGFLYGANFSVGVNIFFDVARAASAAGKHGYRGAITERHHAQKKDAPSGTAVKIQQIVKEASGEELQINSVREGETVGMHVLFFDSSNDSMMLVHDAKSRRGFAEGAVRAAEWLHGKKGFFDFKDVWRELP
jgi:4-hydroxy-tetrahydrodipicolinate reductase